MARELKYTGKNRKAVLAMIGSRCSNVNLRGLNIIDKYGNVIDIEKGDTIVEDDNNNLSIVHRQLFD